MQSRIMHFLLTASLLATAACGGDDATGDLTVLLEAEDTITDGLAAGSTGEAIQDGWAVSFDKYIVAIGDIDIHLATDESVEEEDPTIVVVDLTKVPEAGLPLWTFEAIPSGDWEFNYATPVANSAATRHESVDVADFDAMVAGNHTYSITGTLTRADGQSCPPTALAQPGGKTPDGTNNTDDCYNSTSISFSIALGAATVFGPCEVDEVAGFNVPSDGTQTVAMTIHGDHLFFNGFPEGDEGGVMRLAQWLADSDLNLDGAVEQSELMQIAPSALAELDNRFQLGGSPISPLNNMVEYLTAQLKTQGHFQGEGECPVDGVGHED